MSDEYVYDETLVTESRKYFENGNQTTVLAFDNEIVVIDELSSFKNGKAKRFKSLLKVRPLVKRIVGLTGTPAGNGLMDLWAEFRVLDMGDATDAKRAQVEDIVKRKTGVTADKIVITPIVNKDSD